MTAMLIAFVAPLSSMRAQGYYNLDAGRPGRVEDASPTARYELQLQLLLRQGNPLRGLERVPRSGWRPIITTSQPGSRIT